MQAPHPLSFKVVLSSFTDKEVGTWAQGGCHEVGEPGFKPTYADYKIYPLST